MKMDKYPIFDLRLLDLPRNSSTHCDSRRGQVTIWVILAIILVASILIFFAFDRDAEIAGPPESEAVFDMQSYLDTCSGQYVEEVVGMILPQGGFINPENSVLFEDNDIEYLCENIGYYGGCVNQHPLLMKEIKEEIKNYVSPRLEGCFNSMRMEFSGRTGEVILGTEDIALSVELGPDRVFLFINKTVSITKQGETRRFDNLKVEVLSPIYNLVSVAMEIVSQEAEYCYFEFAGYSLTYPRYNIQKHPISGGTKIYVIEDTKSGDKMNIAIRGCVIPSGGYA